MGTQWPTMRCAIGCRGWKLSCPTNSPMEVGRPWNFIRFGHLPCICACRAGGTLSMHEARHA